ncbi:hypothetical protein GCM10011363_45480 [Marivita lacus]|uniref:Methyltransferase FkbM domain-containing protein n=1 Tax=Marivita lacus TaxID=1323742 RepID=A0ABQ1LHI9_9RHOB|nr:hypothetical protein [Marivita lacus]GGC23826.1 hypothetical protein GCM10011363_45480 [Marivita lacus]
MKLRHIIRDLGMLIAPPIMSQVVAARSQRLIISIEAREGLTEASHRFVEKFGRSVLHGPFTGLTYPDMTVSQRNLIHKLLGSYEDELHPWIEKLKAKNYRAVINVGSADGYYTVGLALTKPNTPVIAFDTDPWARRATQALTRENNARNVDIRTMCTPQWLAENLEARSLLLSDCEGYEGVLLDPKTAPALLKCDIVVELHDHAAPGVEDLMRRRFADTHDIESVEMELGKSPVRFSELADMEPALAQKALSEGRGAPQSWLMMTAREA